MPVMPVMPVIPVMVIRVLAMFCRVRPMVVPPSVLPGIHVHDQVVRKRARGDRLGVCLFLEEFLSRRIESDRNGYRYRRGAKQVGSKVNERQNNNRRYRGANSQVPDKPNAVWNLLRHSAPLM